MKTIIFCSGHQVAVIVTDKDMEELGRGHWVPSSVWRFWSVGVPLFDQHNADRHKRHRAMISTFRPHEHCWSLKSTNCWGSFRKVLGSQNPPPEVCHGWVLKHAAVSQVLGGFSRDDLENLGDFHKAGIQNNCCFDCSLMLSESENRISIAASKISGTFCARKISGTQYQGESFRHWGQTATGLAWWHAPTCWWTRKRLAKDD